MTNHTQVLERLRAANPIPDERLVDPDLPDRFSLEAFTTDESAGGGVHFNEPLPRGRFRLAAASVAAVVFLLAIWGGWWLAQSRSDVQLTTIAATPDEPSGASVPETSPPRPDLDSAPGSPSVDAASFARDWHPISDLDLISDMHGVTLLASVNGLGMVVVEAGNDAWTIDAEDPDRFRSWFSSDGVNWTGGESWHDGRLSSVVGTWTGFTAAGIDETSGTSALWSSTDGVTWERLPDSSLPVGLRSCEADDPRVSCMISIDATDSTLLISGYDPDYELPRDSDIVTQANSPDCAWWLSRDAGAIWLRVEPPASCTGLRRLDDGWAAIDTSGALSVTSNGLDWEPYGQLPEPASLWATEGDQSVAARGDSWLATSVDGGRTWDVSDLPVAAQTEAAAVVQGNFIVVAISAEIGTYVFQRSYDQSGWTEWTSASLTDVPLMSDITALGGALFSVTGDGIWQWGQYRVPDSDVDQQALDDKLAQDALGAFPGELLVESGSIVIPAELQEGVTYRTRPGRMPAVRFTPPTEGWAAIDSGCGPEFGSIRLGNDLGRMFVIHTKQLTVDDAIESLDTGPFVDTSRSDTRIAQWSGRSLAGTFDSDVWGGNLGPFDPTAFDPETMLFPYHTVQEAMLVGSQFELGLSGAAGRKVYGELEPGGSLEIHVVATASGALSVALVADPDSMEEFRPTALALADTLELYEADGASCKQ